MSQSLSIILVFLYLKFVIVVFYHNYDVALSLKGKESFNLKAAFIYSSSFSEAATRA